MAVFVQLPAWSAIRKAARPVNTSTFMKTNRCGTVESHTFHNEPPTAFGAMSGLPGIESISWCLSLFPTVIGKRCTTQMFCELELSFADSKSKQEEPLF
jgi:hypothetical protein